MPDEDDRPRDASGAAPDAWAEGSGSADAFSQLVVPDDIRELADDIAAYHREQRALRRRDKFVGLWQRRGFLPALSVFGAVLLAALIAGVLTVAGRPSSPPPLAAAPIASPGIAAGQLHGLLPMVMLRDESGAITASYALRPAMLALIPLQCNCRALLGDLDAQAVAANVKLDVIAPAARDAEAAALRGLLPQGMPNVFYDDSGSLATYMQATGVTVVLLNADATIRWVQRGTTVASTAHLPAMLHAMAAADRGSA